MLKNYLELSKVDVMPYTEKRDGMDYLNWAVCVKLLHDNGAEKVYFEPLINPKDGTSLFYTEKAFGDPNKKDAKFNSCYETGVHIVIDDLEFDMRGPVMNGANPVMDNSLNQNRVATAQKRLFVKGVAIRTGLGFSLWAKEEQETEKIGSKFDDIEAHNIIRIKDRIQQKVTNLLDKGMSLDDIAKRTELQDEDDIRELMRQCNKIYNFEGLLNQL